MYIHKFVVRGKFTFPLDMLRYDACYPESSQDVVTMEKGNGEVTLVHVTNDSRWTPTKERWSSFLWGVISHQKFRS